MFRRNPMNCMFTTRAQAPAEARPPHITQVSLRQKAHTAGLLLTNCTAVPDAQVTLHLQLQSEALWPTSIDTDAQAAPSASISKLHTRCATSAGRKHALLRFLLLFDPICPYVGMGGQYLLKGMLKQQRLVQAPKRISQRWVASKGRTRTLLSRPRAFDHTTPAHTRAEAMRVRSTF